MQDSEDFSIDDETFSIMKSAKDEAGFNERSWNEWFNYILKEKIPRTKEELIEKVANDFYQKDFEKWVQSFALNLNSIWNEPSARELTPKNFQTEENSAIVIGKGPSLKKHQHLELLANSDYRGSIVCTDGVLAEAIKAGVTPEKFPKYYVITIDPHEKIRSYYDSELVNKYGHLIKGIFSTVTHHSVAERARDSGIKMHWIHSLFDYEEGKKSFNQISALMVKSKNHKNGLPAIQTGGNAGTSAWFVSWQILKCKVVALIGINHGWEEDDPWDMIVSHGKNNNDQTIEKDSPRAKMLFPKIFNPEFNSYCILDPIFQYYSNALKEFISRSPPWLKTINATEGGSIFGEGISCMAFHKFLKEFRK